ncbi:uncharacterized protein LOC118562957 [Fundulus heteroclitus]|uniref:uncharacterized protein LOC110368169 n=1 Tax=Fundulus heteroclitus TaxID=8078 RepID=UPI00079E94E2|nr:uncharacterized protein LOC110368169 [Fundulus heteroclitus]XP_035985938.1 uncharacterized protein LOC110368169 [Fundulus heteroclitus]XP_035992189.1 uncharacterized protein LOC118562957 [Fundulus heteroclitus]XP_035992190.1 uncharacterized protein LOC118562957 [Fundulus heteroclitus]
MQMPLSHSYLRTQEFSSCSLGNMQLLVNKLPSISAGGRTWLAELQNLTKGSQLALGEFRAILRLSVSAPVITDIEKVAQTFHMPDETLLSSVISSLEVAIVQHFPLSTSIELPKFDWNPRQRPADYITQAAETWIKHTGVDPKTNCSNLGELFRGAVLDGVPSLVSLLMKQNPDIPGCSYARWETCLIDYLHVAQREDRKSKQDLEDLQLQLLKLQLLEAKRKVTKRKQELTQRTVSAGASCGAQTLTVPPQSNFIQGGGPPPPLFCSVFDSRFAVPVYGRGSHCDSQCRHGDRTRRPSRRGGHVRTFRPSTDICFKCGLSGHWARDCFASLNPGMKSWHELPSGRSVPQKRDNAPMNNVSSPWRSGQRS